MWSEARGAGPQGFRMIEADLNETRGVALPSPASPSSCLLTGSFIPPKLFHHTQATVTLKPVSDKEAEAQGR